ncbi:hypothetical protein HYN59_15245 [Flavobacterium album]|uniref:Uncharacterized protein n=1 Tax=Flavobacterium album TaxID=2175091 RepID=A0A2S1R125_9FLAO|nr:hypothetical protein [Flavobacterium album]AWH86380.1 hypothetical protein HYN59_15245 [Flavobacterium album]
METIDFKGIASHRGTSCVTISMNTAAPCTTPDHCATELARLAAQAGVMIQEGADLPGDTTVPEKLQLLPAEVAIHHEFGSMSIFLSEGVREVLYSPFPVPQNRVQVADRFDLRPLIEVSNNFCDYNILLLDHKGVRLLHAQNDKVLSETKDGFFPLVPGSSPGLPKDIPGLFDSLDRELITRFNTSRLRYVIAASPAMYSRYMQAARFASVYPAHITLKAGHSYHNIANAAWSELLSRKDKLRAHLIAMVKDLAGTGGALTVLPDILEASQQGRGDILVVDHDAAITPEDEKIYCDIIWNVVKHRGKVLFGQAGEMGTLGSIAMKLCS